MFRRIVSATDLPDVVAPQVLISMKIARQSNGKLFLLHVLDPLSTEDSGQGGKVGSSGSMEALEKDAMERIEKTFRGVIRPEDDIAVRIAAGLPWEEIGRCSEQVDADLIVVGAHGKGGAAKAAELAHAGLGSTAQGVIMGERCPVMVVGKRVSEASPGFGRIMVCMDFSPSCECALRVGKELARENRGEIHLFNMLPLPPYPKYSRERYRKECSQRRERLEATAGEAPPGVSMTCSVRGGVYPHLEIMEFAEKRGVDIIIMGSHTKDTGGGPMGEHIADRGCRWYVGSAVERVGTGAVCPVLVVTDQAVVETLYRHTPAGREGRSGSASPDS